MRKHVLTIVAYVAATFGAQAPSHFAIAADHYASISFMRAEPIFAFGFLSMIIQGGILSLLFSKMPRSVRTAKGALTFSWLAGGILVSYIAIAEAAKYAVPSMGSWISVEIASGFVQFTVFGLLLGWINRGEEVSAQGLGS